MSDEINLDEIFEGLDDRITPKEEYKTVVLDRYDLLYGRTKLPLDKIRIYDFNIDRETINKAAFIYFIDGINVKVFKCKGSIIQ